MIEALRKVIQRLHYPLEVMLVCVRWYAAYPLSLRHIEEMWPSGACSSITPRFIVGRSRSYRCWPRCFAGASALWA